MKTYIFITAIVIVNIVSLPAQVTIGLNAAPEEGALLEIKQENSTLKNSDLGFKIPRVNLTDVSELYPMYGSKGSEEPVYSNNKSTLKEANKGLMVYNLSEVSGLVRGMYIWDGEQWMNFKSRNLSTPSISELICDAAHLEPHNYVAGVAYRGVLKIPYLGGNDAFQSATDTKTVNGLTFTLQPGQLANGAGEVVYRVTGTPTISSPQTTTVPVSFLGHNCEVTVGATPSKDLYYYRKVIPLNSQTTQNSELYVGDIAVRYNYDASRNGSDYIEFKLDMPAHLTYHFDKNNYGTYGQYDAAPDTWYTFMAGNGFSLKNGTNANTNGNLNNANRDIATAHIVIQRDDNRDVYRLTAIGHRDISQSGSFPFVQGTIALFVEKLETEISLYY